MTVDLPQAQTFLRALTGEENPAVTYQTFHDKDRQRYTCYAIKSHGKLEGDLSQELETLNAKGVGVFVMVNEGDGKGRKAENVTKVRALFLDTDGAPMEPARELLRPHIVVESSPGKYHLYWLVSDCPLDRFGPLQTAIAVRFGGDCSVKDLPRVMRLPGFLHQKGEPVLTRLVEVADFPPYFTNEVVAGLGLTPAEGKRERAKGSEPPRAATLPAATESAPFEIVDTATGEAVDLQEWAVKHPDFRLASALTKHSPHVIRGTARDGKQHIRCPFDHEHTEQGADLATFCADGEAAKGSKGFVVKCMHAHCADRDRLDFVKQMLLDEWLPVSSLTDPAFLADHRRPKYVDYPGEELQRHPGFTQLRPDQRARYLLLFAHIGCFIEKGGSVPDDPRRIGRYLDIPPEEWQELRETFIESGVCRSEDGRLVSGLFSHEYEKAASAYNEKIRRGRKGGTVRAASQGEAHT